MTNQPEALRLAEDLALNHRYCPEDVIQQAAAELRRLHAEIERLREELDRLKEAISAVLTHIDDIGARGYYSGRTLEEDAAIEVLRAALKEMK